MSVTEQPRATGIDDLLRRRWSGQTYAEIARDCGLSSGAAAHKLLKGSAGPSRGQVYAARDARRHSEQPAGKQLPGSARRRRGARRTPELDERDRDICARRASGQTLEQIAQHYDLTRERVRQIVARDGVEPVDLQQAAEQEIARLAELSDKLSTSLRTDGPASLDALAERVGCTREELQLALRPADRKLVLREKPVVRKFSDETILEGLRRMSRQRAAEQGRPGELVPVSYVYWNAHRDPELLPTSVRVMQRFSTWNQACEAAGIPIRAQRKRSGPTPRWDDQDCLRWVATFLHRCDGSSSYAAFDAWIRTQPDAPSAQTIRNRIGGWNTILRAAAPELARLQNTDSLSG